MDETEIAKYKKFKKVDGATYRKINQFLRKRTYITAREWALARLCTDFGYSTDSKSAEKTYKAIMKNGKKVKNMGFTEDELIAFVNDLNEHN
jgi:hypothetical protein